MKLACGKKTNERSKNLLTASQRRVFLLVVVKYLPEFYGSGLAGIGDSASLRSILGKGLRKGQI